MLEAKFELVGIIFELIYALAFVYFLSLCGIDHPLSPCHSNVNSVDNWEFTLLLIYSSNVDPSMVFLYFK